MRKLVLKMTHSAFLRRVVKAFRLQDLANCWLRRFPVVKTLPSGIHYRARRVESLALSAEMFDENTLYSLTNTPIQTFADIGCNVGYFTCWLCDRQKNKQFKGLMVDANPDAVEDAQWHVTKNNLRDVYVLQGLAGLPQNKNKADFFLHASNVVSTAKPEQGTPPNSWTRIEVPCLDIESHWSKHFGNEGCDLLKIDIEGSEGDFFRNETHFMSRVKTVLVEWHKAQVSLDEVKELLSKYDLSLNRILHENESVGTAIFSKA
jgi:FkbM family methyltransferase